MKMMEAVEDRQKPVPAAEFNRKWRNPSLFPPTWYLIGMIPS